MEGKAAPARVAVLVLNYNGEALLAECLPSVLRAAEMSRYQCPVAVIDNDSSDRSLSVLAERFPRVEVISRPNRGLCSFNDVLAELNTDVAVLLNNDIKLDEQAIDPLVEPLLSTDTSSSRSCFMTAPLCWRFDGKTYEGLKTAVCWRWGLVQATSLFPGHEAGIHAPGATASAGAVMAVDRRRFLELGGFDPLYLPGRIEDLDFAYRAFQAGYRAQYVPQSVAYHKSMASFGAKFGEDGCDQLALRNTLLFQWKNLRRPSHVARQFVGALLRAARDIIAAPLTPRSRRWPFVKAVAAATRRMREAAMQAEQSATLRNVQAEREFFRCFHPRTMTGR